MNAKKTKARRVDLFEYSAEMRKGVRFRARQCTAQARRQNRMGGRPRR